MNEGGVKVIVTKVVGLKPVPEVPPTTLKVPELMVVLVAPVGEREPVEPPVESGTRVPVYKGIDVELGKVGRAVPPLVGEVPSVEEVRG